MNLNRFLFKSFKLLALISAMLLPVHTFASNLNLACPKLIHEESVNRYLNVTRALDQSFTAKSIKVSAFDSRRSRTAPGYIDDPQERANVVTNFIQLIEDDIKREAIKFAIESLYSVYEPSQIKNSIYRLPENKIAARAIYLVCPPSNCNTRTRKRLIIQAKRELELIKDSGLTRMSFSEIREYLKSNLEGLNSILNHRSNNQIDFKAYQRHHFIISTEFPGVLMRTKILKNKIGKPFTQSDFDFYDDYIINPVHETEISDSHLRKALHEFFAEIQLRSSSFNHKSLFKFSWFDKINLNTMMNSGDGVDPYADMSFTYERLLLLSKYMASAPIAVARVIKQNPEFEEHLCWIVQAMDSSTLSWKITKSSMGLDNYLMPLTIGFLVFTAPFVASFWVAGLVILNVITMVDLFRRYNDNQKLKREINFHKRHEIPNVVSYETHQIIEQQTNTYKEQQQMIAIILAMEVGFGVVGGGAALHARKTITKMADKEKVDILVIPFTKKTRAAGRQGKRIPSVIIAKQRITNAIKNFIIDNQSHYAKLLPAGADSPMKYIGSGRISLHEFNYFIKYSPKDVVKKLLLSDKNFGPGRRVLKIETVSELLEQVYVYLNSAPMSDYTAVSLLFDALTQ